eukprot:7515825-Prorocentrum_lima.AAC.1
MGSSPGGRHRNSRPPRTRHDYNYLHGTPVGNAKHPGPDQEAGAQGIPAIKRQKISDAGQQTHQPNARQQ